MLRNKAFAAIAAAFIGLPAHASATTIDITYTGIVTNGSSSFGTVSLNGDPFTLVYTFDTSLAAPGNYINNGSSSQLSGNIPPVGTASMNIFGIGGGLLSINPGTCNTPGCTTNEIDQATTGSTSQSISWTFSGGASATMSVTSQLFSNLAIPGDITTAFALSGINIGTGSYNCAFSPASQGACNGNGGISASLRIDTVALIPTPLPAALPGFASCLGALGFLGWCRKRKAAVLRTG